MKKFIVAAVLTVFGSVLLFAHPASDDSFAFDIKNSTVTLDIVHPVKDPSDHIIGKIEIFVNGKKQIHHDAVYQTSAQSQTVTYTVPGLKEGDVIKVSADCNKFGGFSRETKAEETKKPAAPKSVKPKK